MPSRRPARSRTLLPAPSRSRRPLARLRRGWPAAGAAAALLAVLGAAPAPAAPAPPPVAAADAPPVRWVALGGTFTAGAVPATGTRTGEDGCARTTGSYPELLRRARGTAVRLVNVSCHGAAVRHISRHSFTPPGAPPDGAAPAFPPVPPQAEAVDRSTDVVSVGAGATDLGLPGLLRRCAELGAERGNHGTPCRDAFDGTVPDRLAALEEEYGAMLWRVSQRSRYARLLAVGYPAVVPEDVAGRCRYGDPLHFATVTFGDLEWLRDRVLGPLNEVLERVGRAHGAAFVDLHRGSVGHTVCDEENWTDGFHSAAAGSAPETWAGVRPNAAGHRHAARELTARHRSG